MRPFAYYLVAAAALVFAAGCDDDNNPPAPVVEQAGQACTQVSQCYPKIDAGSLEGDAICLNKVAGGYCTHGCVSDDNCCAVTNECSTAHRQVCAPLESTTDTYCFLSCEDSDLKAVGLTDGNAYCQQYAFAGLNCRSTGGGSTNRKVCLP